MSLVKEKKEQQGWLEPSKAPKCATCKNITYPGTENAPWCGIGGFATKFTAYCGCYEKDVN